MERIRLGLTMIILGVIALLSVVDFALARIESAETGIQARRYYDAGMRLVAANRSSEAIDPLRKAYAMDRNDSRYALQLASAYIQAGKKDEAQAALTDILERTPNDGEANLLQARLLARRGDATGATAYFHRAIYGTWEGQRDSSSAQVRLELANFLATNGSDQELLAELLPLEAKAGKDLAIRRQVARLYLVARSPARAEATYRELIRDDPQEKSNYLGLAEAALAIGDYRAAQLAFEKAGASQQAEIAAEMAGLDPTVRRLSSTEKFHRSVRILEMARNAVARCPSSDQALLDSADRELSSKVRGPATNELAEERLALAVQLWQQRTATCKSSSADEVLAKLMPKLAQ